MLKGVVYGLFGLGAVGGASICDLCKTPQSRAVGASPVAAVALVPKTVTLHVEGMTCGGCVVGVRKVLTRLDGVTKAEVSYEKSVAVVTYDTDKVTVEKMIGAIKTLGYRATLVAT